MKHSGDFFKKRTEEYRSEKYRSEKCFFIKDGRGKFTHTV